MKWLCKACQAINAEFSYECHNCGARNHQMGLKAPSRLVKQGKFECGPASLAVLIDAPLFFVKRSLGRYHWRNDRAGVSERQLRATTKEFGRDLFWCSFKTMEIMKILYGVPNGIFTLPSLNYPKAFHGVTWRDGEIIDPNYGYQERKYWGADPNLERMNLRSVSILLNEPMSDSAFKELSDLQRNKFNATVALEVLKLAGHDLLKSDQTSPDCRSSIEAAG